MHMYNSSKKENNNVFFCGPMSQGHFCWVFVHFTVEYYIRMCCNRNNKTKPTNVLIIIVV